MIKIFNDINKLAFRKTDYKSPKIEKIIVSMGFGLKGQNKSYLEKAIEEIRLITGQHPILTRAKKSIASFKVREGMILGLVVTLRREKMDAFLNKLINLVLPRIRDFRGMRKSAFDSQWNYSLGIHDQLLFPEIEFENVDQKRGVNVTIVTTAKTQEDALKLFNALKFPFTKYE